MTLLETMAECVQVVQRIIDVLFPGNAPACSLTNLDMSRLCVFAGMRKAPARQSGKSYQHHESSLLARDLATASQAILSPYIQHQHRKQPDNANPPRSDWELLALLEKPQDRIELCLESRRAKLATMVRDWQGGPGALGPSRIGYPTTQSYAVEHFTVS